MTRQNVRYEVKGQGASKAKSNTAGKRAPLKTFGTYPMTLEISEKDRERLKDKFPNLELSDWDEYFVIDLLSARLWPFAAR